MAKKVLRRGFKQSTTSYKEEPKVEESIVSTLGGLVEQVEEELSEQGVKAFDNSNVMVDYLELPEDLTIVESRELGRYFTTFTNQKLYVRGLIWQSGAILKEINSQLDYIRNEVYADLPVKMSVKEKELALLNNTTAKQLLDKCNFIQEKFNMLNTYLDNLIDAITCISREITRRESDWNNNQREDNINKKRR